MFKKKNEQKEVIKTYTKVAVKWLLIMGVINGTMPFVLSYLGRDPVSEMGVAWITEIVAVIIGYLLKSYKETKQEAKQQNEDFQAGMFREARCPEWEDDTDETLDSSNTELNG